VAQWLEELERDYSHPAIVGWCGLNEGREDHAQEGAQDHAAEESGPGALPILRARRVPHHQRQKSKRHYGKPQNHRDCIPEAADLETDARSHYGQQYPNRQAVVPA
ncbi:MAG TPA: hypothetical protein ENH80_01265, partial [Phycisphaerae bacterium]|nr:hypothetical protein [Phycisphaerae bacterium]